MAKRIVKVKVSKQAGYDKAARERNEANKVSLCDRKLFTAERGTLLYRVQMAKGVYGD